MVTSRSNIFANGGLQPYLPGPGLHLHQVTLFDTSFVGIDGVHLHQRFGIKPPGSGQVDQFGVDKLRRSPGSRRKAVLLC